MKVSIHVEVVLFVSLVNKYTNLRGPFDIALQLRVITTFENCSAPALHEVNF